MVFEASEQFARKLDQKDPLKSFRKQFHLPQHQDKKAIYFCGHSLGLQPRLAAKAIKQELKDWKKLAIAGYWQAQHPWLYYHDTCTGPLAKIMGCRRQEVTVMNTLTVNLHLLMLSFYSPAAARYKILMEAGAFPSDQYAVATQIQLHGYDPLQAIIEIAPRRGEKILRTEDVLRVMEEQGESIALVLLGGINYYTGQLYDIAAITAAAHAAGALAGFDLAHAAGNVPLQLHQWEVDFAAWCSYKYLNAGPGGVAGLYIHSRYANDTRFRRLGGWWGNNERTRFKMKKVFQPKAGAGGWQLSTAQVLNMACLRASLQLFEKAGIQRIRRKSILLTGYLEFLLQQLTQLRFEIITPTDPLQRGAQISLFFKQDAKAIHEKLTRNGVVADYREPGVIRVAPAPLYNSFKDVYQFYAILQSMK